VEPDIRGFLLRRFFGPSHRIPDESNVLTFNILTS
jgi:hypothetical protein